MPRRRMLQLHQPTMDILPLSALITLLTAGMATTARLHTVAGMRRTTTVITNNARLFHDNLTHRRTPSRFRHPVGHELEILRQYFRPKFTIYTLTSSANHELDIFECG